MEFERGIALALLIVIAMFFIMYVWMWAPSAAKLKYSRDEAEQFNNYLIKTCASREKPDEEKAERLIQILENRDFFK